MSTKPRSNPLQRLKDAAFFAYSWKLPAYSGASLLSIDSFSFFTYSWSSFAYSFGFFAYSWCFFAHNWKVRQTRALRDCKQRSLPVSNKAPTVSAKNFPQIVPWRLLFSKGIFKELRVRNIINARHFISESLPCPSFPWSFRKHQGKPPKYQGSVSPCEPSKTL